MKRFLVFFLFAISFCAASAQGSVIINVEDLTKPTKLLPVESYQSILKNLIQLEENKKNFADEFSNKYNVAEFNIVAKSNISGNLVNLDYHPFFEGMYYAYAEHRPFTLSPDMIWLLICQGFAQHVNNNSEKLRHYFVDFKGKITLVVKDDRIDLKDPNSPWPDVFPVFSKEISDNIGKELIDTLTADFSTTTVVSRVATQITLMDAFKSYFEFVVISAGCGIPKVTLEGTTADWQKVLSKTEALRKYNLDWWVDKMEPVLSKIIEASKGKVDKPFWQGIFKYHAGQACRTPAMANGWILKFFPYTKEGNRSNFDSIGLYDQLPPEIVKVDVLHIEIDKSGNDLKTPLELWSGFVGLKQNDKTFGLKPEIGWMIRKKSKAGENTLIKKLKSDNAPDANDPYKEGITIRVKTIPNELMQIGPIHTLTVFFTGDIVIPDELSKIKIDKFVVFGKIDSDGKAKLRQEFPNTNLFINPY